MIFALKVLLYGLGIYVVAMGVLVLFSTFVIAALSEKETYEEGKDEKFER